MLCSVVKHLSGRALKKWGKTLNCVSCFPLHFFRVPACFTTEQSTVEVSLLVKCYNNCPILLCLFLDSGSVYTFGLNDSHQLGHSPVPKQCLLPKMVIMRSCNLIIYSVQSNIIGWLINVKLT